MRIHLSDSILLAVDFQTRLMPVIEGHEDVVHCAVRLLSGMAALGMPLLVSQQYPKGLGATIPAIAEAASGAAYFDKTTFSCLQDTAIQKAIAAYKRSTVILCGVEAHICVLQTAVDLLENGYRVVYVTDCVGSRKSHHKHCGIQRAVQEGALPATHESILFELLGSADAPAFKTISKLIK